jgi:hypothetical protein
MSRCLKFIGICIATIVAGSIGSGTAVADNQPHRDGVTKPFVRTWTWGACSHHHVRLARHNVYRHPRLSDTKGWQKVDETSGGVFMTTYWVRNSYSHYDVFRGCVENSEQAGAFTRFKQWVPTHYRHKERYVNWVCDETCVPLSVHTTHWKDGFCARGTDGMVCPF